jgi:predicted 3-demethylubiquinone-9 3-methyltransferase (glyoxalase superfamily)
MSLEELIDPICFVRREVVHDAMDLLVPGLTGNQFGEESVCGGCKDRWGLSWQITPRVLTRAMAAGGAEAKRAFEAMMEMVKIDIAKIEAAIRG